VAVDKTNELRPPAAAAADPIHISKVILDYAASIQSAEDIDEFILLNAGLARDLSGADRCSIWLIDPKSGELWTKVAHGLGPGLSHIRLPAGKGLVGACVRSGTSILVNDVASDPRFFENVDRASGYVTKSILVVPLRGAEGEVIGALQVLNKPDGFNSGDVELLNLSAVFSAAAIEAQRFRQQAEESRLLNRELIIAREVQEHLFPRSLPSIARLDSGALCRPARFVGGDYYDFIELADGTLAFTLGDVSGKGIAAALMMSGIQAALRASLLKAPSSLAAFIEALNRSTCASSPAERYSTLFFGMLDPPTGLLKYVNAGHVQPLLLRCNGVIERLSEGGIPVGLLYGVQYDEGRIALQPGDTLLCLSDGFTEAMNPAGEIWGEDDIEALFRECRQVACQNIVQRMLQAADRFAAGAEQSDDMTVLVLRLVG
jgi:phosphoserine phosphatase RsbU/P